MNKQEALEVALEECRKWETTPQVTDELVWESLRDLVDAMADAGPPLRQEHLGIMAGALVWLMVDESEPVVGVALEAWLARQEPPTPPSAQDGAPGA